MKKEAGKITRKGKEKRVKRGRKEGDIIRGKETRRWERGLAWVGVRKGAGKRTRDFLSCFNGACICS